MFEDKKSLAIIERAPEATQPFLFAVYVIILGYFVSKIFAAFIGWFFRRIFKDQETIAKRAAKFVFWVMWLTFMSTALRAVPMVHSAFDIWHPAHLNYATIVQVLGLTLALFFVFPRDFNINEKLENFNTALERLFSPISNRLPKIVYSIIFLIATIGLHNHGNVIMWFIGFMAMMFIAMIFSKALKEAVNALFNEPSINRMIVSIVYASFIVGGLRTFSFLN